MEGSAAQKATTVDYPSLAALDPGLANGYQPFGQDEFLEVPVEIRSGVTVDLPTEAGALDILRVRILTKEERGQVKAVRVELTSDNNLFVLYHHDLDENGFKQMQEGQRLTVDLGGYPTILTRMLRRCISEPHTYIAVFIVEPTGDARLDFIQITEFKYIDLLSCRFIVADEADVRAQVNYRYNAVSARLKLMEARLMDVNAMIKVTSPTLLRQLQEMPTRIPGMQPQSPGHLKPFKP